MTIQKIINYPNGDVYEGFVLNNNEHGEGIKKYCYICNENYKYYSGTYKGNFLYNKRND